MRTDAFLDAVTSEPMLGFVMVDDGSRDETSELIESVVERDPQRFFALRLEINSGKAEAVRRGVLHAFERKPDLIGYWDADRATPLSCITTFAKVLEAPEIEMVFGSRVRLLGRHVERSSARHYFGRGFATIAASALGLPIYDTQCGAKLFRADEIFRGVFSRPFESDWSFDVELFARLLAYQTSGRIDVARQCVEYPLEEWVDVEGSKLTARHLPRVMKELATLIIVVRRAMRTLPPP